VCLFGGSVINKPEGLLDSEFSKKGRIEHHFYAMNSISIVFIEVKKTYTIGKARLDVIAQVLAESAGISSLFFFSLLFPWLWLRVLMTLLACDYANSKLQHWVPILAILCDGEKFEFLVYDSGLKSVYSSGKVAGVFEDDDNPDSFATSLKKSKSRISFSFSILTLFPLAAEYIFDYILMAYINGLRSFGNKSKLTAARSKSQRRESTDKWMDALARAERAHLLCREAAELAREKMFAEAEESATRGIDE